MKYKTFGESKNLDLSGQGGKVRCINIFKFIKTNIFSYVTGTTGNKKQPDPRVAVGGGPSPEGSR
jgi:hypothetical protein